MIEKEFTPEQVISAVKGGITKLKGLKVKDTDALATVAFSDKAGPVSIKVGGAADIEIKDAKPGETKSGTVPYLVRMAIMGADFESTEKEVCLKSAGFHSQVTPNATFNLNYELVSYCQMAKFDSKNKCFILGKGEKISFILPNFLQCKDTDAKKLVDCYCKALENKDKPDFWIQGDPEEEDSKGNSSTKTDSSTKPTPTDISDSNPTSTSKSTNIDKTTKEPNTSGALSISQTHNHLYTLFLLFMIYVFFIKRH